MHTTRERWLLLFGLLFLLAAGNYIANQTSPERELYTFALLVVGTLVYIVFERCGWVELFYLPDREEIATNPLFPRSFSWGGHLMFWVMTAFCVGYVELTGQANSPLFCILYLPILIAGLRYGVVISLSLGMALAARYFGTQIIGGALPTTSDAVALSFPLSALFGVLLRARLQTGLLSASEKVIEMSSLMDISQMLEMAIDLETTVNLLLINARRTVEADVCAVYLLDSNGRNLQLAAPLVDDKATTFCPTLALQDLELGSWHVSSDDILRLHRPNPPHGEVMIADWPESRSNDAMIASLVGSEGVLGLLYVARSEGKLRFSKGDEMALKRFATHVSMPLQKARYQESLSVLAFKDEMTELSNFRYFEQRLSEEMVRAKRYQQTLTLVIMDIDYFKKFNDDYGHKAGDALLRQFGFILKDCLRESDLPARYGGEEFIAICPAISCSEARQVAERIRTSFEAAEFDLGPSISGGAVKVKITVSVGFAMYPDHAVEPGDLVRNADRALYAAKQRGRNTVVSCEELSSADAQAPERTAA